MGELRLPHFVSAQCAALVVPVLLPVPRGLLYFCLLFPHLFMTAVNAFARLFLTITHLAFRIVFRLLALGVLSVLRWSLSIAHDVLSLGIRLAVGGVTMGRQLEGLCEKFMGRVMTG